MRCQSLAANGGGDGNEIDYTTPNLGGFTVRGVYGMWEVAGSTGKGSTGGLSLASGQPA